MGSGRFIKAAEVAEDFEVSESKAYMIIKELNEELQQQGYITVAGRVSRKYYLERTYSDDVDCECKDDDTAAKGV